MMLEKEKEETTLKLQEQEATIQAFGKPRIPLSRSSSASSSSSCADSDHAMSSSGTSSVSTPSSERELAFSTFSTLALQRKVSPAATTLTPPKPAPLAHRRGSSLQHTRPLGLNNGSNVVSSEYGYLSFTIPSKGADADAKVGDGATLTPAATAFDLTARL